MEEQKEPTTEPAQQEAPAAEAQAPVTETPAATPEATPAAEPAPEAAPQGDEKPDGGQCKKEACEAHVDGENAAEPKTGEQLKMESDKAGHA